jgi:hypothetical protein
MSLRLTTPFISTNIPGAYPNVNVISQPTGLGTTGIVVIFGEASGGASYENTVLANNVFTSDQLAQVTNKYISGSIVDAFTALCDPSNDTGITGTASQIYIAKTNDSTKAASALVDYGALLDLNWGVLGNQYQYQVLSTGAEVAPTLTGNSIATLSSTYGASFSVRKDGGAAAVATVGSGPYTTAAQVAASITGLPSNITASGTTVAPWQLTFTEASDVNPYADGSGKSFELIDSTPGDLAALGFVAGLTVSSQEPSVEVNISRPSTNTSETLDASASIALTVGYVGTTATLTINPTTQMMTTTVTGGTGGNLSINLAQYSTIGTLATYISSLSGYSATAIPAAQSLPPSALDAVTAIGIASTGAGDQPGRIKNSLYNFETVMATSSAVSFTPTDYTVTFTISSASATAGAIYSNNGQFFTVDSTIVSGTTLVTSSVTNTPQSSGTLTLVSGTGAATIAFSSFVSSTVTVYAGLPSPMALPAYLSGGTLGATLGADITNVIAQLAGIQCNIIVPLFSENASEDILLGLTDPASNYAIESINVAVKNHCITYSTPSLKRNRICILSYWDNTTSTYLNAAAMSQSLANYRCSLAFQQVTQVNSANVITQFMPWYGACVAAGMQAGGFYKSICNKLANVISEIDPAGFDSGSPGDVEEALSAGLLILTNSAAGPLWVSDQTTYGFDTNFVYNSIQAVYDSDILALNLAASFQSQFVGQSLADVDAATALSYMAQLMLQYKALKLIAASDDAPLGWKNGSVQINGPVMTVQVEIKLATAIYFIPISINISQVQTSA